MKEGEPRGPKPQAEDMGREKGLGPSKGLILVTREGLLGGMNDQQGY